MRRSVSPGRDTVRMISEAVNIDIRLIPKTLHVQHLVDNSCGNVMGRIEADPESTVVELESQAPQVAAEQGSGGAPDRCGEVQEQVPEQEGRAPTAGETAESVRLTCRTAGGGGPVRSSSEVGRRSFSE
jgi:hypothetical protein